MTNTLLILGLLIYTVAILIITPFFSIWALNTLFGLQIAYTFKTWVATFWAHAILHGIRINFNKPQN